MGVILTFHFGRFHTTIIVTDWKRAFKFMETLSTLDDADIVRVQYASVM